MDQNSNRTRMMADTLSTDCQIKISHFFIQFSMQKSRHRHSSIHENPPVTSCVVLRRQTDKRRSKQNAGQKWLILDKNNNKNNQSFFRFRLTADYREAACCWS